MAQISSAPTTVTVTDIPPWAPNAGQYASISLFNPSSANPCPSNNCVYSGNSGFAAVWTAWNGGAYAPTIGKLGAMLFFGGGHFAYDGNEVVAYDVEARRAFRLSEPAPYNTRASGDSDSANVLVSADGEFPNGTPYPNHTNMAVDFVPSAAGGGLRGSFVFVGHDNTGVRITSNNLWRFDLQARSWNRVCTLPFPSTLGGLGTIAYDTKRQVVWAVFGEYHGSPSGILFQINLRTATAKRTDVNSPGGKLDIGYMPGFTYVQHMDCIVFPTRDGVGRPMRCIDLNGWSEGQPVLSYLVEQAGVACPSLWLDTRGDSWQVLANCDRLEYCPDDGRLYALDLTTTGACRLFSVSPPLSADQLRKSPWTWSSETLKSKSGESLALRNKPYSGTDDARLFGRLRYVPALKSFLISDHPDLPVQALRPGSFV